MNMSLTFEETVNVCADKNLSLSDFFLEAEMTAGDTDKETIIRHMDENLSVMERAAMEGLKGVKSRSGLTGGDAKRMSVYLRSANTLTGSLYTRAMMYAMAINEVNASMGVICATPTAGSSGVVPGVLLAVRNKLNMSREQQLRFLITCGGCGILIGNQASLSGAAGGCQAEVGSAAAMAAAALVEVMGGTPAMSGQALAMALKNLMGLTCDPVAGLVEVPCVKRNAGGVVIAISAAEMAMAGIESRIPVDEVIRVMGDVGKLLPVALRETALGGLARSETAVLMQEQLQQNGHIDVKACQEMAKNLRSQKSL